MSTAKKILLSFLLVFTFLLMSAVIYKTENDKNRIINSCDITKKQYEKALIVLDSLSRQIEKKEDENNIKDFEAKKLKEQIEQLKKEKEFLTDLPKESDIKKIKFNN